MSLSFRLIALVLIAAGPAITLQFYNYTQEFQREQMALQRRAAQMTKLAGMQFDSFLEGVRMTLEVVGRSPEVRSLDPERCSARLKELRAIFPEALGLGAVRADGIAFCGATYPPKPVNIGDRPYFREAMLTREFAASGYVVGRQTGQQNIVFAQPVLGEENDVRAVVVLVYQLQNISERLVKIDLPDNATIALVDRSGRLLARAPRLPDAIGETEWAGEAFAGPWEGDGTMTGSDGVQRLYNITALANAPNLFVALGVPVDEALSGLNRDFWLRTLLLCVVFVFAGVAAYFAGRVWISRPLRRVGRRVARMADGDLKSRVGRIRGPREIAALGRGFDSLAEAIANLVSEIDHRANNQLSVVQSLIRSTAKKGKSADEFSESLSGRLEAMGRIQNLVSRNRWRSVSLKSLVETVLRGVEESRGRVDLAGRAGVDIAPNVVFALGLAIHELATNAAQHGAWSVPRGRVRLAWEVEPAASASRLVLRWTELNGPPAMSGDAGTGWTIVKRRLEYELDAKVDFAMDGDGLKLVIDIPLRAAELSVSA